jgi:PAS domain S-box-containing protein
MVIDAIPEAMIIVDCSHRIIMANRTARELAGGKDPVAAGMTCFELSHNRDTPCTGVDDPCPLEKVIATGAPVMVTHKHYDASGRELYVDVSAAPIKDEKGEVIQIIEAHRDITDRKHAEEMLQKERDFVTAVIDTAGALVIVLDGDGRIVRFNRACERISGYSLEDVEGRVFWDFLLIPEEIEAVKEVFNDLRAGHFPNEFENYWVARDGSRRWIAWSNTALVDETGEVEFVVATGVDITERRQVEEYQALTARLLERLNRPDRDTDALPDIVGLIKDFTGLEAVGIRLREGDSIPCLASNGSSDFFHISRDYFDGKDSVEACAVDGKGDTFERCMCAGVLDGKTDHAEPGFTEGGSFWINSAEEFLAAGRGRPPCSEKFRAAAPFESAALIPVRSDEEIIGLLQINDSRANRFTPVMIRFLEQIGAGIGMAIKRRRAEKDLTVLNETLELRVAERTSMLEERAAQLRKLAADLTQTEQRERRRLAHLLHDHLQQLLVGAKMSIGMLQQKGAEGDDLDRTLKQIEEMLDLTIDTSRTLAVELSPPILYDGGLAQALEWLASWMKDKYGLTVELEADRGADPELEDVRILLFQAVRELLFNVVKHAGTDTAHVHMSRRDGDWVRITVTDFGIGFNPVDCKDRKSLEGGFGLLSICERIDCLGGSMTAESVLGKGTRMILTAPIMHGQAWSLAGPESGSCGGSDKDDAPKRRLKGVSTEKE